MNVWNISITAALVGTVPFLALYFYYKWPSRKVIELEDVAGESKVKMGKSQILTLLSFLAFIVGNIFFGLDLMVVPVVCVVILLCLDCAKPQDVIKGIPWPTLFMIGGMTVYVSIIKILGGVDLLVSLIAKVADKSLAPGIMAFLCAFMSLFSSGNGVVIPTMTSTISALAEQIPGLNTGAMFVAVLMGANATCISPMSTVGATALSYYAAAYNPSEEETRKVFNRLFIYAAIFIVWSAVAGFLGLYGIINH